MLAAKKRPRADNVADGGRNQRVTRFMRRHAGSVQLQAGLACARATWAVARGGRAVKIKTPKQIPFSKGSRGV